MRRARRLRHGGVKLFPALLAGAILFLVAAVPAPAAPRVAEVGVVEIPVADLDRSVEFFTKVLTFRKVSEAEVWGADVERLSGLFGVRARNATLRLGDESIRLTEYLAPRGRPVPQDSRSTDRWFQHVAIIVSDMERAYRRLREFKVPHASSGPQRLPDWNKGAGGIQAFYFRDPDDHFLEILAFPPGKGLEKWHAKGNALFLGIDHTAIVVADTEASLRFYRDTLGLQVAGESENYGSEQEHLNQVFGARLRITALRAGTGPGIELLEYLAPRDGRPYPGDSRASDLWSWQTHLVTADAEEAAHGALEAGFAWVSPGAVPMRQRELGIRQGAQIRDPDGHAILLEQR